MVKRQNRRQLDVLEFVESFVIDNGFPPSYEEIRVAVGLSSRSHVHYYLNSLERGGLIVRLARRPRSVRPTELEPVALRAGEGARHGSK